jgi:hypothetical protein
MLNRNSFLLNCIKASLQGTLSRNDIRELAGKTIEWDSLLNDALVSGTGPLLYYTLKKANADSLLPGQTMSKLEMAYYSTFTHHIFYYKELNSILGSFQRSGVQSIVLKGAALAKILYPDTSIRPFGDIDLLIRDQDLHRAESELQCLGYIEDTSKEFHRGYRKQFDKHFVYLRRGSIPMHVELHTSLLPFICAQKLEADGLWDRSVDARIGEAHGLVLSAEDMVLHLCIHIFNHSFSTRLLWLYDVALMISEHGRSLDWKSMEERARALGVYRIVGIVLNQVSRTFDIPMPQYAACWFESCKPSFIEKVLSANGVGLAVWRYILRARLFRNVKDKLKLVAGQLFPSSSYIMQRYSLSSPRLLFLGYCYHFHFTFLRVARAALICKSTKADPVQRAMFTGNRAELSSSYKSEVFASKIGS